MIREIVLDTETTGLDPRKGHRVIEIACVELLDLLPTGRHFHQFIDPQRDIDPDAERIHGLSRAFLSDKPTFEETVEDLVEFLGDSPIIAHNAAFDRGFMNNELERIGSPMLPESRWIDSLAMAQKSFPGMFNSLDALCKRFRISLADREKHGALIDAQLLAGVYLELRGGREARLDLRQVETAAFSHTVGHQIYGPRPRPARDRMTDLERSAHARFVAEEIGAQALWLRPTADI